MQKITFENLPSTNTPLNANNLNTLQDNVEDAIDNILLNIYPVGSIYMSINNTNPSTLFGGTWEQIQDRFLLSAGSTYTAGNTGGEATHTLTVNEMPSHAHDARTATINGGWTGNSGNMLNRRLNAYFEDNQYRSFSYDARANIAHIERVTTGDTSETGGGQAHNNMPPYLVVYMWKRTA